MAYDTGIAAFLCPTDKLLLCFIHNQLDLHVTKLYFSHLDSWNGLYCRGLLECIYLSITFFVETQMLTG